MLWTRIQSEKNESVRRKDTHDLFEVLQFLVIPSKCFHEAIEEHFQNPFTYVSCGPCLDNCSYCLHEHIAISGLVPKPHVIGALQANIFQKGAVNATKIVSLLTDKRRTYQIRDSIWGKPVESGQVHGLVLMLLASGMIELQLKSQKFLGTKDIKLGNVRAVLAKTTLDTARGVAIHWPLMMMLCGNHFICVNINFAYCITIRCCFCIFHIKLLQ